MAYPNATTPNANFYAENEVEYPLPILEKGVEIVDSPGLNDTEARNQLTLNYVNRCHAVLFVLSATQQFTLGEQRYLDNYIKDRGLTVFFLINAWDEIKHRLVDPDDEQELQAAEERVRQVFRTNLKPYCQLDGEDGHGDEEQVLALEGQRIFEVSSLNALRQRLKGEEGTLEGTGFDMFLPALTAFLTQKRAIAELRQAKILSRHAYHTTHNAIERRIPLLSHDIDELREKIWSVQPEFEQLLEIRDQFKDKIRVIGERKAGEITDSFRGATAITVVFTLLTDIVLGPIGMALAGLGLGSWTTEQARRKVLTTMKTELSNLLPQIAQEQSFVVYQVVKECFETYQQDVVKRMNEDIAARKTELSELVKQKESREIDRDAEVRRLNGLDDAVLTQAHQVADAFDQLLGIDVSKDMPPTKDTLLTVDVAADDSPTAGDRQEALAPVV